MSKLHDLLEEQKALENEMYYLDGSEDDEDATREAEIDALLSKNRGGRINTLIFLYGIWRSSKLKQAARHAQTELIKKDDLKPAIQSEKLADKNVDRIAAVMLRILDDPAMVDINLPDGKTINKKLNPGSLVMDESKINYDLFPESLTRVVPEHYELLDEVMTEDGKIKSAKEIIKAEFSKSIKDDKNRLDQSTSFVTLDEFPGFALVRDAVIQVK